MPRRIKDYLITLSAGLCFSTAVLGNQQTGPEHLTLLSRACSVQLETHLNKAQRQWLQNKRELVLGTASPDYPPFDLTSSGRDYEGLTADYAGLLARAVGLPIKVYLRTVGLNLDQNLLELVRRVQARFANDRRAELHPFARGQTARTLPFSSRI